MEKYDSYQVLERGEEKLLLHEHSFCWDDGKVGDIDILGDASMIYLMPVNCTFLKKLFIYL